MFEATGGATFPSGTEQTGCDGTRFANSVKEFVMPELTMPSDGSSDVRIWAGFMQVRDAANVTPTFTLKGKPLAFDGARWLGSASKFHQRE